MTTSAPNGPLAQEILIRYVASKPQFSARSQREYRTTLNNFSEFLGRPAEVSDFTDDNLAAFLRWRIESGKSAATAKKDRQQILTLWRWCWRKRLLDDLPRDIPEIKIPRKIVRAWHPREVAAILAACHDAETENGWGPLEWQALVLTIYDSAERISALLECPLSGFDPIRKTLFVPARVRKHSASASDLVTSLHESTCSFISRMVHARGIKLNSEAADKELLFAYWAGYQTLFRRFRDILRAAEIPLGGRKLFHDLRRTNYTLTWAMAGREAASIQCGHSQDLSQYYLDHVLLQEVRPQERIADVIPRPILNGPIPR